MPAATAATSLRTPVLVSAWTRAMTLGAGWAASRAAGIEGLSPRRVDPDHLGAAAAGHVAHALAEQAVDPDHHHVARSDRVDEGGFHAGRSGARHRQGEGVGRLPHGAQPVAGLVEDADELGIEVAEHGPGQPGRGFGVGIARARDP